MITTDPFTVPQSTTITYQNASLLQQRPSIRRGTISSISKDVRVNDFVEIIKQQKALTQRERLLENNAPQVLRRRHSVLNISNSKQPITTRKQQYNGDSNAPTLPSRKRTLSNNDLGMSWMSQRHPQPHLSSFQQPDYQFGTVTNFRSACNKHQTVATSTTAALTTSAKVRLVGGSKESISTTLNRALVPQQQQHHRDNMITRRCEACSLEAPPKTEMAFNTDNEAQRKLMTSDLALQNVVDSPPMSLVSDISPSDINTSSTLSTTSSLQNATPKKEDVQTIKQQTNIIKKDIFRCMLNYSKHLEELTKELSTANGQSLEASRMAINAKRLNECKDLSIKQKQLLEQLEALMMKQQQTVDKRSDKATTANGADATAASTHSSLFTSIRQAFKSTPKYETRQIIIRQKPGKKETDTIFSVHGVCTTAEASYIPKQSRFLGTTTSSPSPRYKLGYHLNITFQDRQEKFTLLARNKWDSDDQVHTCQDKNCTVKFNWRHRKHHCRRCGHIFCALHSGNRLPLFQNDASAERPCFSRVCDGCFFELAQASLVDQSLTVTKSV